MKRKTRMIPVRFLRKVDRRIIWSISGLFTYALAALFYYYPLLTELLYSNGLFVAIRWIFDHTLGLLPFSIFYLLAVYLVVKWVFKTWEWVRFNLTRSSVSIIEKTQYTLLSIFAYFSKLSFLFFFLWGFNYFRIPVEDKMNLQLEEIAKIDLFEEANYERKRAIDARNEFNPDPTYTITFKDLPKDMKPIIRESLEKVLKSIKYPTIGKVQVRYIQPDGFLTSMGITGFYDPFLGEANVDRDFSALYLPFLVAHEMVHGYGFGDEGTANFLAYLACEYTNVPIIKYSGRISYLLYLSYHLEPLKVRYTKALRKDISDHGYFSSQPQYDKMIRYISAWRKQYQP